MLLVTVDGLKVNAFYGAIFVSDFFLAGAVVKGIAKGGVKAFSKNYKSWSGWRGFYGKQGFGVKRQELHHWLWMRNGQKSGSGFAWKAKNQMWNLKGMPKDIRFHQAIHGKGDFKQFKTLITLHYAVPNWVKAGGISIGGRLINTNNFE